MPITAAAINDMVIAPLGALIDRSAVVPGATVDDGVDDFAVISRHALSEALDILRAIIAEDVLNGCHDHLLLGTPKLSEAFKRRRLIRSLIMR